MTADHKCPACSDEDQPGSVLAFVNYGPSDNRNGLRRIECRTCSGTGRITDERHRQIAKGRKLRETRVARGESLREAAERHGITMAELCSIEFGRVPVPEGFKP